MEQDKKEVCTMRVMFPVASDEQAIDVKKKIAALLTDIADAMIDFRLSPMPTQANGQRL
ncbi:unnamed protein product [marine sediment metagenome]|uniref:Uncharacterized protein n=1 Tax=marine sediment metagenome TaxID=412755 RepID=X1QQF6_9ZZZZ